MAARLAEDVHLYSGERGPGGLHVPHAPAADDQHMRALRAQNQGAEGTEAVIFDPGSRIVFQGGRDDSSERMSSERPS